VLAGILEERVASGSRGRRVPRGVKRKMGNYQLRPRTPQPTVRIDFTAAIRIVKRTVLGLASYTTLTAMTLLWLCHGHPPTARPARASDVTRPSGTSVGTEWRALCRKVTSGTEEEQALRRAEGRAAMAERVLIYRLGSIGDTAVALPCFKLIARAFPDAERVVLTNYPARARDSSVQLMLDGTGLIHGCMEYPLKTRSARVLAELRARIRRFDPDVLIYLSQPRGLLKTWRDVAFFKLCGVPRIIGAPLTPDLQRLRHDLAADLWEAEAHRLARCLAPLGDPELEREESWHLGFTSEEATAARLRLAAWPSRERFVATCVGAKVPVNDWEEDNWRTLLTWLGKRAPAGLGLMFVGALDDRERSARLEGCWPGPTLNLAGELSPRVSAAALAEAELYIGTDGGPMHLAASSGVPCIAVFSARNWPGEWFPRGAGHRVLLSRVPCMGCRLEVCTTYDKMCVRRITPDQVLAACLEVLAGAKPHGVRRYVRDHLEPSAGATGSLASAGGRLA
jgi:ADP-heptose:LPS heptosyltransferase